MIYKLHIFITERIFEDEERFEFAEEDSDAEWPEKRNTFSGLSRSNSTRWGSISKMSKSHLKNNGE